jgi:hypothetical protein
VQLSLLETGADPEEERDVRAEEKDDDQPPGRVGRRDLEGQGDEQNDGQSDICEAAAAQGA